MTDRLIGAAKREEDELERTLRPQLLSDFTGQARARENLAVFIEAARQRGEALDHRAPFARDPPGPLAKTTLAQSRGARNSV